MSSAIQSNNYSFDPREKALVDIQSAVAELTDKFNKREPLSIESFERIEEIFKNLENSNTNLRQANIQQRVKWLRTNNAKKAGVCITGFGIFLLWANPILNGILYYLQSPNSQTCTFQNSNSTNSTITVTQTNENNNELQIGVIIGSTVAAILLSLNSIFGECNKRIVDDYEREKSELAQRTNLNKDLRNFFRELRAFDENRSRDSFRECARKINELARNEIIKKLGSKEKIVSDLLRRVNDPEVKAGLERLQQDIKMDINEQKPGSRSKRASKRMQAENEEQLPSEGSKRRKRVSSRMKVEKEELLEKTSPRGSSISKEKVKVRRRVKFEKGGLQEESVRRGSVTYLTDTTKDSIRNFVTNLGLGFRLDRLQIGDWWISENGAVSRKEADTPDLSRQDSVAVTAPLEVDLV